MRNHYHLILILIFIMACQRRVEISLPVAGVTTSAPTTINTTIEQAVSETVGTCNFSETTDPSSTVGFEYRITFSGPINDATFDVSDITNSGTGGGTLLTWTLANCGDDTNYKLTASAITGEGTIIPGLNANVVQDLVGTYNSISTATDNTISYYTGWYQEAYIKASKPGVHGFGGSIDGKPISLNKESLAVGAYEEDSIQNTITNGAGYSADTSIPGAGAVFIYGRSGNSWVQEAYIKAVNNDIEEARMLGSSVAIDNDTLAVGSRRDSSTQTTITNGTTAAGDIGSAWSGAVFIYKRTGVNWAQEAFIKASNNGSNDYFGEYVSLDGDTLIVGAYREDSNQTTITNGTGSSVNNSNTDAGAVYVYRRTGVNWAQEAYIKASNNDFSGGLSDQFGKTVSLSSDTIAVGAPFEDSNQTTITNGTGSSADNTALFAGAVYIYKRTGTTWAQEAYIKAPVYHGNFGHVVSLNSDILAVGQPNDRSNQTTITNGAGASADTSNAGSGAVYIFKRTGVNWAQEAYIKAVNNSAGDQFGSDVSVQANTLIVGAPFEDSDQTTITNGTTASANDLSLSSGAVYIYKRTGATWAQEAYLKASNNNSGDNFGRFVSLSADSLAVSADNEDSNQTTITNGASASTDNSNTDSGAIYIYRNKSRLFEIFDLQGSATSSSVTLTWSKTGGSATGYLISYVAGAAAPIDCASGTDIDVGDVDTHSEITLSASTTYSFRVCATDGTLMTDGATFTVTTDP